MISGRNNDPDAVFFHYCLHHFHWTPQQYRSLDRADKALVIASIGEYVKKRKQELDEIAV